MWERYFRLYLYKKNEGINSKLQFEHGLFNFSIQFAIVDDFFSSILFSFLLFVPSKKKKKLHIELDDACGMIITIELNLCFRKRKTKMKQKKKTNCTNIYGQKAKMWRKTENEKDREHSYSYKITYNIKMLSYISG